METIIGGNGASGGANGSAVPPGALIKESNTAGFVADVIEASRERPVIVDFWAEWCGPCKQLGPMLEQAVTQANGAVAMVKIDVDANQELAQQLRIQSIPAVFAFKDGKPVDAFQGALPESQLKEWLKNLIDKHGAATESPADEALASAAQALGAGDHQSAAAIFSQIIAVDGTNVQAHAGLAHCLIAAGEPAQASAMLAALDDDIRKDPEIQAIVSGLELAEQGAEAAGRSGELRAALEANPKDHQARYDLALALFAEGEAEQAMSALLDIISVNAKWNEEAARHQLLKIFEALGPADPRVAEARRRLSSVLFS